MGPIYAKRIGLDISLLSVFMSVAVMSAMLFQWPVGRMSDFLPRNRVVLVLALAGLGASALTAFWGSWSTWLLLISAALYVGFASTVYPISLALAHDQMHHGEIVGTNATLLLAFGAGTIIGPVGASTSIWLLGPAGLFLFTALVMGVLAVIATHYWKTGEQVPVREQEHFVAVTPVSTQALMEMDPRDETYEQREEAAREHSIEDAAQHGRDTGRTHEL
jgi:MFS family permease